MAQYTKAAFLQDPAVKTPVFVRFSTVAGSRGSTDLARDVRGFAVKFYTDEGIFDIVGNNIPVFFIQDAMKFPDLVHAVKPEPHNEIPQAASAHDTFWDFISLMPESMHMIMWVMSDRAIPRSFPGEGSFNRCRCTTREGGALCKVSLETGWVARSCLAKAQKSSGKDPDFHAAIFGRREHGHFPEWELGVQIVKRKDDTVRFRLNLIRPKSFPK